MMYCFHVFIGVKEKIFSNVCSQANRMLHFKAYIAWKAS
jgi:hypothetical protein